MPLAQEVNRHRAAGVTLLNRGLLVAAREEFQQWLAAAEASADPSALIPPLNALVRVAMDWGDHDTAYGYLKRALEAARTPGVPPVEALRVYLNLMRVGTDMLLLEEAVQWADEAAHLMPGQDAQMAATFWLNKSLLHYRRVEWVPMLHAANRAIDRGRAAGDEYSTGMALLNRGIAHLEMGAHRLARRDLSGALRQFQQTGSFRISKVFTELGRLHFVQGDFAAALSFGREALNTLLTDVGVLDKEEVARVSHLFGGIFASAGQRNLSLKYLNRAAAYFSQLGFRAEWQRCTENIGEVLTAATRPARGPSLQETHRLDFLTAVLDLTDDLESVDPYLRGRSERIASLAVILGQAVAMEADDLKTLAIAGRLHDVGMIAVDVELIRREGPLTDAERRRVAVHCEVGEEMLRPYGLPRPGLLAIRHHHEHYDGRGYPDGLAGSDIPIMARIISVVDVYDALTSERAYRSAMAHAEACQQMRSMAGSLLDPQLVDRFLELYMM